MTANKGKELLPCPFCGGEAKFGWSAGVMLAECKECGPYKGFSDEPPDDCDDLGTWFKDNWNRRASIKQEPVAQELAKALLGASAIGMSIIVARFFPFDTMNPYLKGKYRELEALHKLACDHGAWPDGKTVTSPEASIEQEQPVAQPIPNRIPEILWREIESSLRLIVSHLWTVHNLKSPAIDDLLKKMEAAGNPAAQIIPEGSSVEVARGAVTLDAPHPEFIEHITHDERVVAIIDPEDYRILYEVARAVESIEQDARRFGTDQIKEMLERVPQAKRTETEQMILDELAIADGDG